MFETVLVANRGEIACRVITTLGGMGIRSVATYSDADAGARHVRLADVSARLGPAPAAQSYLAIDRIIDAALATDADAIHPGYGFLAESADLARACEEAGLVFIGPGTGAIEIMGDKIRAKAHVSARGVPTIPGLAEPGLTNDALAAAALELGFPLLIKPSAGGGGKGMHLVQSQAELRPGLESARREAAAAFGNDELFIERFVTAPRHIEVQVLADNFGHTIHLGERECSLQRRHQKVIEEAPSALLDAQTRARIGAAGIETAASTRYRGAGTVEFIVSAEDPGEFFFMEMNTRLQVEHPVTEMITGIDLVEWQLRIAAGERLTLTQEAITFTGHAIEARVYAEDPSGGFLPTGGTVIGLAEPAGPGIRVDSALVEGLTLTPDYDPMLAKVIAHGRDRPTALARLDSALAHTAILGVGTNVEFLRLLLADDDVRAARLDTELIDRRIAGLEFAPIDEQVLVAAALISLAVEFPEPSPADLGTADRWARGDGWRITGPAPARFKFAGAPTVRVTGTLRAASVTVGGGDPVRASARIDTGGGARPARARVTWGALTRSYRFASDPGGALWISSEGRTWELPRKPRAVHAERGLAAGEDLRSPMPGTVILVPATDGARVEAGEPIVVVEAMKMEHVLCAPHAGTVTIHATPGTHVASKELLARISPITTPEPHSQENADVSPRTDHR